MKKTPHILVDTLFLATLTGCKTTPQEAIAIAERTHHAYAYAKEQAYTPGSWRECCRLLARFGYTEKQIEWIMLSQMTFWASFFSKKRGRTSSNHLAKSMALEGWDSTKVDYLMKHKKYEYQMG
jgi:hypothetical protein